MPLLYAAAQLAAAPFFPGYSFLTDAASLLGSDRSTLPSVFNAGAFLTGVAALSSTVGFNSGFAAWGVRAVWRWLAILCLVSVGVAALWASFVHLPDPRHNPGALGAGMFALPVVFAGALWRVSGERALKLYLVFNLLLFALLVPVMAGKTGLNISQIGGLLQRMAASVFYLPIGVVAFVLLRRSSGPRRL